MCRQLNPILAFCFYGQAMCLSGKWLVQVHAGSRAEMPSGPQRTKDGLNSHQGVVTTGERSSSESGDGVVCSSEITACSGTGEI